MKNGHKPAPDLHAVDGHQVTVHAQHGWHADGKVHVGTALGQAEFQK
jgi:hypothetical protein